MFQRMTSLMAVPAVVVLICASAFAQIPPHPKWKSSARMAQWTSPGTNFAVRNNMWNCQANPDPCGRETIWADSYRHWGIQTTQAAGNTAVLSYPDVQKVLTRTDGSDTPLSSFTTLKSTFSIRMPSGAGLDDEAAYDDWLNSWTTEVMIWVNNQGQTPAGSVVAHPAVGGRHWALWATGTKGNDQNTYSFVAAANLTHGTVNTLAMLRWLVRHGWIPASSGVSDDEFGFEVCSTGGHPASLNVTRYSLTARTR